MTVPNIDLPAKLNEVYERGLSWDIWLTRPLNIAKFCAERPLK